MALFNADSPREKLSTSDSRTRYASKPGAEYVSSPSRQPDRQEVHADSHTIPTSIPSRFPVAAPYEILAARAWPNLAQSLSFGRGRRRR
jgi:hypothetical protein